MSKVSKMSLALQYLQQGTLLEALDLNFSHLLLVEKVLSPLLDNRRLTYPRLFLLPDSAVVHLLTQGEVGWLATHTSNSYLDS